MWGWTGLECGECGARPGLECEECCVERGKEGVRQGPRRRVSCYVQPAVQQCDRSWPNAGASEAERKLQLDSGRAAVRWESCGGARSSHN
eukprot:246857-Chlamydomonas_euryale.AAC.2